METIIGLIMFYAWVHGAIIVGKKVENTTQYENVVMVVALVGFILYLFGTM